MIILKINWINTVKILSSAIAMAFLTGCQMFQPTAPSLTPGGALESLYIPVASSASGLWWPLLFSGFLAILAGIINAVVFRGGHKIFLLGILLASIPPIADYMMRQSSLVISLTVLTASLMMLVWVAGKWFGWRAFGKEIKPLTYMVRDKRHNYTAEDALTIIESANTKRPKDLQSKIQGELQ
jgi:hypothetical protein